MTDRPVPPVWLREFEQKFAPLGKWLKTREDTRTLYCISEGYGAPIKIGITQDIKDRHRNLQHMTWRQLYVCWTAPGQAWHEYALKAALLPFKMHGEWFRYEDDAVKQALTVSSSLTQMEEVIERFARQTGAPAVRTPGPRVTATPLLFLPRRPVLKSVRN